MCFVPACSFFVALHATGLSRSACSPVTARSAVLLPACVCLCARLLLCLQFISDVIKPLNLDPIIDQEVKNLSGGELQRVALALCLGKPADVYLIDEPSAYLDSEQRIVASKIIKRFILHAKKTAFVVEHDFIMATYLADRVIVYEGEPGREATANSPQSLLTGMNAFLKVRHSLARSLTLAFELRSIA